MPRDKIGGKRGHVSGVMHGQFFGPGYIGGRLFSIWSGDGVDMNTTQFERLATSRKALDGLDQIAKIHDIELELVSQRAAHGFNGAGKMDPPHQTSDEMTFTTVTFGYRLMDWSFMLCGISMVVILVAPLVTAATVSNLQPSQDGGMSIAERRSYARRLLILRNENLHTLRTSFARETFAFKVVQLLLAIIFCVSGSWHVAVAALLWLPVVNVCTRGVPPYVPVHPRQREADRMVYVFGVLINIIAHAGAWYAW